MNVSACADDIGSVYYAGNIATDRQQNVDPELKAEADLQQNAKRWQEYRENDANEVHDALS